MAAIASTPFERGDEAEGFLIVTAAADQGLVDIHDRRSLVLTPEAAREWLRQDVTGAQAVEIAGDGAVSIDHFTWYPRFTRHRQCEESGARTDRYHQIKKAVTLSLIIDRSAPETKVANTYHAK